jgi:1-acyl-sn-glycerol-3-phosphate acyltransferase
MMIRARHNWLIYSFFKLYTVYKIKRNFYHVHISGNPPERDLPVLVVCNHISWWDGFWVMYVNMKLFHRKFFFMMLEDKLNEFSFFKSCGGYPVRKNSKSILQSLQYTAELLTKKNNLVLMFPQGEISSLHRQQYRFERGLGRVVDQVMGKIQIIFIANLVDYFSERKPSLYVYIEEYEGKIADTSKIEEDYNKFYSACVSANIAKAL